MVAIRLEVAHSMAGAAPLRAAMNALNLASRRPCPFSTYEYLLTFVVNDEYASPGQQVLFLSAFEGDRLIGYLPLRREKGSHLGLSFDRLGLLVSHDTDRPHVVARPEDEARCCAAFYTFLLGSEGGWSVLDLAMQDAESGLTVLPPLSPWRFMVRRFENMPNTTVPLPQATFADYYLSLGRSHRQNVSRLGRRLLTSGNVEVVSCTDARGRSAMLDLYLDLERRSWKQEAAAGIGRSARRVKFFRALCAADQPLQLGFDFVLLDGLPIAGMVSGAFGDRLYGLEMAFDGDHDDLAPGHLLSLMAIRRAIAGGFRFLNLNGNYSYYKAKLGGVVTATSSVQIFRVGSLPWARTLAGDLKRRLRALPREADHFNPERRRVSRAEPGSAPETPVIGPPPERPPRHLERGQAQTLLQALADRGVHVDGLSGAALAAALPFNTERSPVAAPPARRRRAQEASRPGPS